MRTRQAALDLVDSLHLSPFVAGSWNDSSAASFAVLDPATEQEVCQVVEASATAVDRAVTAARAALETGAWRALTGAERGLLLNRAADLLEARAEQFVLVESLDVGKTGFEPTVI